MQREGKSGINSTKIEWIAVVLAGTGRSRDMAAAAAVVVVAEASSLRMCLGD
jgi:hypothetical protein